MRRHFILIKTTTPPQTHGEHLREDTGPRSSSGKSSVFQTANSCQVLVAPVPQSGATWASATPTGLDGISQYFRGELEISQSHLPLGASLSPLLKVPAPPLGNPKKQCLSTGSGPAASDWKPLPRYVFGSLPSGPQPSPTTESSPDHIWSNRSMTP